jgi:ATP-binding cassette subfamily B protein
MININSKEPFIFMCKYMWKFSKENKKTLFIFIFLFFIANIIHLLQPLILGYFLNEIQNNGVTENNIFYLVSILFSIPILSIIFWAFHGPARVISRKHAFLIEVKFKKYLFNKVLNQGLNWHNDKESGDMIDKINNASSSLSSFVDKIYLFEEIILRIIGSLFALAFFSIYISIFLVAFIIISFFIMNIFDKKLIPQYKKLDLYNNKISATIFDSITNITTIIILDIKKSIYDNISKSLLNPFSLFIKNSKLNEIKWFSISIIMEMIFLAPVAFYIFSLYKNNQFIEIGTIVTLLLYLQNISQVFFTLGQTYEGVIQNKTSMLNALSIESLNVKKEIKNSFTWENIYIKDLIFSYKKDKEILNIKNFTFNKGEKIAIIGESGSGKTTFLKLLHGLYDIHNGKIFSEKNINLIENKKINFSSMLIPQDPELFSMNIKENLSFNIDFENEKLNKMIELSNAKKIIDNLENGLESVISEKGLNLSGGQKQRIALCRALLFAENKDLILMDESTSSVDAKNEKEIYKNIFNEFKNTTIIASIHKLNLLKYFQKIVIIENGKIVDIGNLDYLLKNNLKFKDEFYA